MKRNRAVRRPSWSMRITIVGLILTGLGAIGIANESHRSGIALGHPTTGRVTVEIRDIRDLQHDWLVGVLFAGDEISSDAAVGGFMVQVTGNRFTTQQTVFEPLADPGVFAQGSRFPAFSAHPASVPPGRYALAMWQDAESMTVYAPFIPAATISMFGCVSEVNVDPSGAAVSVRGPIEFVSEPLAECQTDFPEPTLKADLGLGNALRDQLGPVKMYQPRHPVVGTLESVFLETSNRLDLVSFVFDGDPRCWARRLLGPPQPVPSALGAATAFLELRCVPAYGRTEPRGAFLKEASSAALNGVATGNTTNVTAAVEALDNDGVLIWVIGLRHRAGWGLGYVSGSSSDGSYRTGPILGVMR